MTTHIEIDGNVVQLYESVYEYASRNASFSDYADEKKRLRNFRDQVSIIQVGPFDSLPMRFGRGVVDGG